MFYQTFSGTLGLASAIGFVSLIIMVMFKKYTGKKEDSDGKIEKSFFSRIRPQAINAIGGRLLSSFAIIFMMGFFPSCICNLERSENGAVDWVWILIPKELMVILFPLIIFFILVVLITHDMNRRDYKLLED